MSSNSSKALGSVQKLGKALMTPVAVLPAAALLLRLGQPDLLNIAWMSSAGNAIFSNLPLIFAIGIAVGFADENNGVAGLAAAVGYFVLTQVAISFNKDIDMGVLAGIIVGILAGNLYNKYKAIKVPDFLGFFGGKRFVPIITSLYSLILGVIAGLLWPLVQNAINSFGNAIANAGVLGSAVFGFFNRLLIPVGLHHVINSLIWFQFGTFTDAAGKVVTGDLSRFFAGDPNAGIFMTGAFPIMMFGLPAAAFAMIAAAKKERRKEVTGMLLGVALTSFLTGITEPIEFLFIFLSPVLYVVHALLTSASFALTTALGIKDGFGFSAGLIDYIINFGIATKPLLLILVGLLFGVIYFFVFFFMIKKFDMPTPGREPKDEISGSMSGLNNSELMERASQILEALGGKQNLVTIDACITRLRLTVKDPSKLSEHTLKQLGVSGVVKMGSNNFQIVVGTVADPLATHIKALMKE